MSPREPKPRTVVVDGRTFERIPVRTRVLMPGDDIAEAIREHAGGELRPGDTVLLSESAVAIMQGRARDWRTIHPGRLARWMSEKVIKTSWGTGLRSPYAMQYAIELSGTWRILVAGGAHVVGRALGRKGWFYLVAGLNARMMDAEHTMGVAEFYEGCIPAPADPKGTVTSTRTGRSVRDQAQAISPRTVRVEPEACVRSRTICGWMRTDSNPVEPGARLIPARAL